MKRALPIAVSVTHLPCDLGESFVDAREQSTVLLNHRANRNAVVRRDILQGTEPGLATGLSCQPAGDIVGSGAGDSTLCVVELLEVNDDASDETVVEMVEADYSVLPPRSEPPHLPPQVQQGISRPRMTAWRSPWQSGQIIRRHPSAAGRLVR